MKIIKHILGIIFAISLITICMFSSIDLLVYGNMPGFFVGEVKKYGVLEEIKVSEEDMNVVTTQMFDYLKGRRESMADITATIDGKPDVPFFNAKECSHMADCQGLFLAGMQIRRICIYVCLGILLLMLIAWKHDGLMTLARDMIAGTIAFLGILGAAAIMLSQNFYKYFVIFHETFFDNDNWLLDPATDRLICIMPEGFFVDCVKYLGIIFGAMIVILLVVSIIIIKTGKKKAAI